MTPSRAAAVLDFGLPRCALPQPSLAMARRGMAVRPATEGDLPFLRALYAAGRAHETGLAALSEGERIVFLCGQFALQLAHFRRHHAAADFLILVHTPHGGAPAVPVGRIDLDRAAPVWRLLDIAIVPGDRGQGLGSVLIGWLKDAARGARAAGIDLHVARDNPRAAALYRRLGFVERASDAPTHRRMIWPA